MGKVLNMTYASSLTDLCEVNSSFDTGVLRICYTGQNKNKSSISKDVLEKCIPSLYNCPIVCNYDRESDTLGGHDMEVVRSDDGELKLINSTQPVGVIPESAKVWFDTYEEDDGTVNEYLYADVLLWKRQEAYSKIKNDGITAHSMEITVKDGQNQNGIFQIYDFEFTAFCLIGVTPCFESSCLQTFSENNFKQQMSEMMQDLKETFSMVNPLNADNNTHPQNFMEGGNGALDENTKILDNENGQSNKTDFALTEQVIDELMRTVSSIEAIKDEWGERPRYMYADSDFETKEVYCWDRTDWLLYGFSYDVSGDSVNVDAKSKKRKKYAIVDFDDNEQESPFEQIYSDMKEAIQKSEQDKSELETKFNESAETIKSMETELTELREFKADIENKEVEEKYAEVLSRFEDLSGIEAFENLRENYSEFDLDALEEKCFAIRGRVGTVAKFSANENKKTPIIPVDRNIDEKEPYGGLFTEYGKANN